MPTSAISEDFLDKKQQYADRPLLVACPSCNLRLRHAYLHVKDNEDAQDHYEKTWGLPFNPKLEILLNLEVRCSLKEKGPVMHFSEILSLALGIARTEYKGWFSRHLVDPKPFLKALDLF